MFNTVSIIHEGDLTVSERSSALVMVVYNHLPSFESLTLALNSVDYVLLMDNGSSPSIVEAMESFASSWDGRCIVVTNGSNLGISRAYNRAFQILRDIGVYWIFMADHDALFSTEYFRRSRQVWSMASENCNPGVVVPIVADDPGIMGSALGLAKPYSMVSSTITSGIMTNMDVIDRVNGFDERFFVEAADIDFTIRIRKSGKDLVRINQVLLAQGFGSTDGGMAQRTQSCIGEILQKYGYMNLRLNLINNISLRGYSYGSGRIASQDESNRVLNRTHRRFMNELIRLYKKYIIKWG